MVDLQTHFASSERSTPSQILARHKLISSQALLRQLLDYCPDFIFILDCNRQIVFANQAAVAMAKVSLEQILGRRPGEILGCGNAQQASGCGTSRACRFCGAVQAILESRKKERSAQECFLLLDDGGTIRAVDFRVWAATFDLADEQFTMFMLLPNEDEKRRRVLERIFFHDILNTATAIKGFVRLANQGVVQDPQEIMERLETLSERIIDEIRSQRLLLDAEDGKLSLRESEVESIGFCRGILQGVFKEELLSSRVLEMDEDSQSFVLQTDKTLLGRILVNMITNGLEAALPGERVTLGCCRKGEVGEFYVHNPGTIPEKALGPHI